MKVVLLVLNVAVGHAYPGSWDVDLLLSPGVTTGAAIAANVTGYVEDYEKLDKHAHCLGPPASTYMVYQQNLQNARTSQQNQHVLQAGQNAGLTQPETVAIYGWTLADYEFINPIAWGAASANLWIYPEHKYTCSLSKAEVWPYIQLLNSAVSKLPPAQPVGATLWRGSKQSAKELGNVISGGYSSCSRDFDAAFDFVNWRGGSLWAIESHTTGKDISKFSEAPSEGEVLFWPDSRLKVVECSSTTINNARQQEINKAIKQLEQQGKKLDVICLQEASAASEAIAV